MPAFAGHLDGVREPKGLVLLSSPLDSAPALCSEVNMDTDLQTFPML